MKININYNELFYTIGVTFDFCIQGNCVAAFPDEWKSNRSMDTHCFIMNHYTVV
jgi:hypothetical protein